MAFLYAVTLFVSAGLLFAVQPMIAKFVLSILGGTPAVWSVCMLFFQAALLAGYAYAHASVVRLSPRAQALVQISLLLTACWFLPFAVEMGEVSASLANRHPARWLLWLLVTRIGLPVVVIASTAPLLQRWFARSVHPAADDPYFLYAGSNLGSLLALLGYPLLIEPALTLDQQVWWWTFGYAGLVLLTVACSLLVTPRPTAPHVLVEKRQHVGLRELGWWVFLAFVPSSLMLGVTTFVTTDIAAVPLLWVIPLALYLLSFILVFARRLSLSRSWPAAVLPFLALALTGVLAAGFVHPVWIPLHLLTFFVVALVCHGALADRRPEPGQLTSYYLALAFGGVLGGTFNGLLAPRLFDRIAEYPLAVVLACLALPPEKEGEGPPWNWRSELLLPAVILALTVPLVRNVAGLAESGLGSFAAMLATGLLVLATLRGRRSPLRLALSLGAVLLASGFAEGLSGRPIHQERNFFGVLRVTDDSERRLRRLFHGNTLHGEQSLDPGLRREPLAYFRRGGPIDEVIRAARGEGGLRTVGVAGLGAGTLAALAEPGERWTYYEIDPAVVQIAGNPRYFTFLRDCRAAKLEVVLGDARVRLRQAPPRRFDLLVLDAFSSDAVPVHLLTREALALYRSKLARGGRIAWQITNRYLDLDPVLGRLAADAGLVCRVRYDLSLSRSELVAGQQPSIWLVMAEREADLGPLAGQPTWRKPRSCPDCRVWTDRYANPLGALVPFGRKALRPTRLTTRSSPEGP